MTDNYLKMILRNTPGRLDTEKLRKITDDKDKITDNYFKIIQCNVLMKGMYAKRQKIFP